MTLADCVFERYADHRDLHVRTHFFPTLRSSFLARQLHKNPLRPAAARRPRRADESRRHEQIVPSPIHVFPPISSHDACVRWYWQQETPSFAPLVLQMTSWQQVRKSVDQPRSDVTGGPRGITQTKERSEERRAGREWGRTCRSRWSPDD